ncbi:hypothetical protein BS17DRAFT_789546 [Gyrodon lividus]|nr:hypothetical protein BS17DRAFT_789546 [Gyrodon lividus]
MTNPQSNASSWELDSSNAQLDQLLNELEQEWRTRELVSLALREANTAFVSQFTEPDGYRYMDACGRFNDFLALNIPMVYTDQKTIIQILQVACAMHENAVNSPVLSATARSAHQLASSSLVLLVQKALDGPITFHDLRSDLEALDSRAGDALTRAAEALDLSQYLKFSPSMLADPLLNPGAGSDLTQSNQTGLPMAPVAEPSVTVSPAKAATEVSRASRPFTRCITKEKAREMFNDPTCRPPPTRTQSMPVLSCPTSSFSSSRTARTPFRAHPRRGNGLGSLTVVIEEE